MYAAQRACKQTCILPSSRQSGIFFHQFFVFCLHLFHHCEKRTELIRLNAKELYGVTRSGKGRTAKKVNVHTTSAEQFWQCVVRVARYRSNTRCARAVHTSSCIPQCANASRAGAVCGQNRGSGETQPCAPTRIHAPCTQAGRGTLRVVTVVPVGIHVQGKTLNVSQQVCKCESSLQLDGRPHHTRDAHAHARARVMHMHVRCACTSQQVST